MLACSSYVGEIGDVVVGRITEVRCRGPPPVAIYHLVCFVSLSGVSFSFVQSIELATNIVGRPKAMEGGHPLQARLGAHAVGRPPAGRRTGLLR